MPHDRDGFIPERVRSSVRVCLYTARPSTPSSSPRINPRLATSATTTTPRRHWYAASLSSSHHSIGVASLKFQCFKVLEPTTTSTLTRICLVCMWSNTLGACCALSAQSKQCRYELLEGVARLARARYPKATPSEACMQLIKEHMLPHAARDHAESFRSKVRGYAPCVFRDAPCMMHRMWGCGCIAIGSPIQLGCAWFFSTSCTHKRWIWCSERTSIDCASRLRRMRNQKTWVRVVWRWQGAAVLLWMFGVPHHAPLLVLCVWHHQTPSFRP